MEPGASTVAQIMTDFAQSTGLEPAAGAPRRYLWTDAFAVCNFLELYRLTGDAAWQGLALGLVDQVHHTLGRHRADDRRRGWLSSLPEAEGELYPTRGGLRIGKPLPERSLHEMLDEREWDRDGQYFHYLTKWMHALDRVSRATGDGRFAQWARELALTAHEHFSYRPAYGGAKRMHWKMSIDLSRPQVPSMGQHDPLDGLVTYSELLLGAEPDDAATAGLRHAVEEMARICQGQQWETDDPLGIGGLLFDAARVAQLVAAGDAGVLVEAGILEQVAAAALAGLELVARSPALAAPARQRLAFRELGLGIGLHAALLLRGLVQKRAELFSENAPLSRLMAGLDRYLPLGERIERFWLDDENRNAPTWQEHRDINMVMLATSLAPGSFVII